MPLKVLQTLAAFESMIFAAYKYLQSLKSIFLCQELLELKKTAMEAFERETPESPKSSDSVGPTHWGSHIKMHQSGTKPHRSCRKKLVPSLFVQLGWITQLHSKMFFARSAKKNFGLFWFGSSLSVTCRLNAPRNLWALWVLAARMYCNTNEFSSFFSPQQLQRQICRSVPFAWSIKYEDTAAETADRYGLIPIRWLSLAVRIQLILRSRCKKSSD